MESGGGSRGGCRHSRSLCTQSCYLQVVLMCIVFIIHVQSVASELTRNETAVLADRIGSVVWNKTLYKTERKCVDFYNGTDLPSLFYYWPEADAEFDFCCAENSASYKNYTYGISGPQWNYMIYYDLGLINECLPYWKCLDLFEEMMKHVLYIAPCEFNDLRRFYKKRFWNDTVIKRGFLQSAIPFILLAEIAVIVFVSVYWFLRRRRFTPLDEPKEILRNATGYWKEAVRPIILMDWTHLCLLAVVGNGLIEAVGRQPGTMQAQAKTFYNYGRLYIVLSILVWTSSVLHQISIYIAEIEFSYREANRSLSGIEVPGRESITRQSSGAVELERDIDLGNDWKWQPIGAQAGILFCLWGFLTYAQSDATTGAVFGIIVSAAAPWSGLYASKIIVYTVKWILKMVYDNLIRGRPRALWTKARFSAFLMRSGSSHVQLNDLSAMDEHEEGSTSAV